MENNTKQKISIPTAIIVAGLFIMVGLLLTKTDYNAPNTESEPKTLSEQVGVSKSELSACINDTDMESLNDNITISIKKAMLNIPQNERGTPYSIVIGPNGVMADIRGAYPYQEVKAIIAGVALGEVASVYTGEINLPGPNDHVYGNPNASITVIEYSDFECPYCKSFHSTMKKIVAESDGNVNWIYRHFPLHQTSFEKLVAAECVTQVKGNDAFWEYTDLLFGLLKTDKSPVSEQL